MIDEIYEPFSKQLDSKNVNAVVKQVRNFNDPKLQFILTNHADELNEESKSLISQLVKKDLPTDIHVSVDDQRGKIFGKAEIRIFAGSGVYNKMLQLHKVLPLSKELKNFSNLLLKKLIEAIKQYRNEDALIDIDSPVQEAKKYADASIVKAYESLVSKYFKNLYDRHTSYEYIKKLNAQTDPSVKSRSIKDVAEKTKRILELLMKS